LPTGLLGRSDEVFEDYVGAGLEFLVCHRVAKYGHRRRGESMADGVSFLDPGLVMYDAKAAAGGYEVSLETVRQSADYISDFVTRYNKVVKRVTVFLLVSSSFSNTRESLEDRSMELFSRVGTVMSFLDADTLANAVEHFVHHPRTRQSTDWMKILTMRNPTLRAIKAAAQAKRYDDSLSG
jgi:hypothetical protein